MAVTKHFVHGSQNIHMHPIRNVNISTISTRNRKYFLLLLLYCKLSKVVTPGGRLIHRLELKRRHFSVIPRSKRYFFDNKNNGEDTTEVVNREILITKMIARHKNVTVVSAPKVHQSHYES